ncbi:LOW QUALITY PROTEIN: hypothetical protein HZS_7147 [Henneguya salminicola]|nr:LOW QUALITY PROTEIN: hypothetical protein HZS_7147 [Henneguya salminicola]
MSSLPSIEADQINEKLQEIQNLKGLNHQNWPRFWEYFSRYSLSNIRLVDGKTNDKQKTSTHTQTKRYKRRLGSKFQNAHPYIFGVITAIKDEEHYFSNLTRGIRSANIPSSVEFEY